MQSIAEQQQYDIYLSRNTETETPPGKRRLLIQAILHTIYRDVKKMSMISCHQLLFFAWLHWPLDANTCSISSAPISMSSASGHSLLLHRRAFPGFLGAGGQLCVVDGSLLSSAVGVWHSSSSSFDGGAILIGLNENSGGVVRASSGEADISRWVQGLVEKGWGGRGDVGEEELLAWLCLFLYDSFSLVSSPTLDLLSLPYMLSSTIISCYFLGICLVFSLVKITNLIISHLYAFK